MNLYLHIVLHFSNYKPFSECGTLLELQYTFWIICKEIKRVARMNSKIAQIIFDSHH